ncbi:MAG: hypothetical protein ACD_58C00003G0004 [uncultured bacterium]|nr:MAG: hypothetical protein ACD_58C00003G0004 [uncultured bacterium]
MNMLLLDIIGSCSFDEDISEILASVFFRQCQKVRKGVTNVRASPFYRSTRF